MSFIRMIPKVGAAALLVVAATAGCSSGNTSSPSSSPAASSGSASAAPTGSAGVPYPAQVQKVYTEGCIKASTAAGVSQADAVAKCACVLRAMTAKYSIEAFAAIDAEAAKTEQIPQDIKTMTLTCKKNSNAY